MRFYKTIRQAQHRSKYALPAFLMAVFMLLSSSRYGINVPSVLTPLFLPMGVFYWTLYWPRVCPKWLVMALGFVQDVLLGLPIGTTALAMLVLWGAVMWQREFLTKEPFWVIWLAFGVCMLMLVFLQASVVSAYYAVMMPLKGLMLQGVFTVLCYPFVHALFNVVHMSFLKPTGDVSLRGGGL